MKQELAQKLYSRITKLAVFAAQLRHPGAPPAVLYECAWSWLHDKRWMKRLAASCRNNAQLLPEEKLVFELSSHPKCRLPRIRVSPASAEDTETLKSIRSGAIVVTVHYGRPITTQLLLGVGLPVCLVSRAPRDQWLKKYPTLKVIQNGPASLARIRRELMNDRVVCCAVDRRAHPPHGDFCLISPGMFELARRMQIPMHFTSSSVSATGIILMHVSPPHYVRNTQESIQAFIAFHNAWRNPPRHLVPVIREECASAQDDTLAASDKDGTHCSPSADVSTVEKAC